MNRTITKLFRKVATTDGTFNKALYKALKKNYQSGPYSHFSTQQFLDQINREQKESTNET